MSPNANTINDFIIGKSFEQDMFDPEAPMRADGSPLFERDVVDGEFERIHAKKSRRKKVFIAIGVFSVVAGAFLAVVQFAPSLLGLAPPPVVAFPMAAAGGAPAGLPQQSISPATTPPPAAAVELPPEAAPPSAEATPSVPPESPFQNEEPQQPAATPPTATPAPVVAETPPPPKPVKPASPASPKPTATKPITVVPKPEAKKQSADAPASGSQVGQGGVTPVVTLSSAQMGVRSFSADSVVVQVAGGEVKSYRVGDSLPNGEKLQKLDPTSMTMVTDRRVIRIK